MKRAYIAACAMIAIVAAAGAPAAADDADVVGQGIAHAAAVSIFCSEKTDAEVGAPVPVINIYFREASAKFAERYGKPLDRVADYAVVTKEVRSDPAWLAAATRDDWPPACNEALDALTDASRGDFAAFLRHD